MSERFQCPEPSDEAIDAMGAPIEAAYKPYYALRAAYAVDVPAIVQSEVTEALNALAPWFVPDKESRVRWYAQRRAYLAARFPEAAPELVEPEASTFTQSFDARDWAKAFVETVRKHSDVPTSEGAMIGWFANALMRGYDEHASRTNTEKECCAVGCTNLIPASDEMCVPCTKRLGEVLAEARPEAGSITNTPVVHCGRCGADYATSGTHQCICVACPCARCVAERDFLRALVERELRYPRYLTPAEAESLVAAARRVVEAKP